MSEWMNDLTVSPLSHIMLWSPPFPFPISYFFLHTPFYFLYTISYFLSFLLPIMQEVSFPMTFHLKSLFSFFICFIQSSFMSPCPTPALVLGKASHLTLPKPVFSFHLKPDKYPPLCLLHALSK